MSDLTPLFRPKSVALIGASSDTRKYGYWTAKSLIDNKFTGQLYLISRTAADDILGYKPYASISDVPGPVDLAIVGIAPKHILPMLQECADKGVKAVIVVSTGFGETGPEGKALEQQMLAIAAKSGMRIMGPNCMGMFSAPVSLNASIIDLEKGHMGLVLQSGNFGIDINFNAKSRGLGYSGWATIGNQIDLRFADFVEYLGQDEATRVVAEALGVPAKVIRSSDAVADLRDQRQKAQQQAAQQQLMMQAGTEAAGAAGQTAGAAIGQRLAGNQ